MPEQALWLCRFPSSSDLFDLSETKKKGPYASLLCKAVSDAGAMLSFLMLLPVKILFFWQVVAFQNLEIVLDMIQSCELRFQFI